tara:strand:+ start:662 stop:877 length:216 start_codon:yes stop_codon:yes gene_type:complete
VKINLQDKIITELEEKITGLKMVLENTIEKHSDAAFDLKDLKLALEELSEEKFNLYSEKMLVMASEWEDVK